MDRESIYNALFSKLQNITGIQNASRKFTPWDKLQPEQMPYLMALESKEVAEVNGRGIPIRWTLLVDVVIYIASAAGIDGQVPASLINPLIDRVEQALDVTIKPETLGGLADKVRIRGTVEKGQDALGTRGWCVIPVEVVTPA